MGYVKHFFITIIALVFVILKHSLQWRGEFYLYFGPVPEFLLVNSAARRFSTAAGFEGKFLSSFLYWCFHWPYMVVQVYELITCVRRANENAGNLISVVQFLIYIYMYIYINCKHLCRMKILKSMKTKVFLFFAFALRVSPLLRLFRHSKVCLLNTRWTARQRTWFT